MTDNPLKNLVVICGPTASGKTTLGVTLALKYNGEIISADSRQIYKRMDIGTGKDLDEYSTPGGTVPFHLIDIVDPYEIYTLYHYKSDSLKTVDNILKRDRLPFLVGGTGLYIEAVLRDYDIPAVPENPELRKKLMQKEPLWLENELKRINPKLYLQTDLSSKKRIIRSIEITTYNQENTQNGCNESTIPSIKNCNSSLNPVVICTKWDRSVLRERIDTRLKKRLDEGLIDEVRNLINEGIPQERFVLFGMEYKHVAQYLKGETSYTTMVEQLKHDIHRLAKRQETWFRGMQRRGIQINWINNSDADAAIKILDRYKLINNP
ncbi:MAG TPA: tRNA (adenosine(37)-N6)-dimethylallyltransferase MiaA [Chitinispirillaceae bacterium]|nr:tRNA (adenosine(37)-N6)-dimethylallyltransferase MiaA [Chitinispirillaceae bacterium]